jgi:hypothetical protein
VLPTSVADTTFKAAQVIVFTPLGSVNRTRERNVLMGHHDAEIKVVVREDGRLSCGDIFEACDLAFVSACEFTLKGKPKSFGVLVTYEPEACIRIEYVPPSASAGARRQTTGTQLADLMSDGGYIQIICPLIQGTKLWAAIYKHITVPVALSPRSSSSSRDHSSQSADSSFNEYFWTVITVIMHVPFVRGVIRWVGMPKMVWVRRSLVPAVLYVAEIGYALCTLVMMVRLIAETFPDFQELALNWFISIQPKLGAFVAYWSDLLAYLFPLAVYQPILHLLHLVTQRFGSMTLLFATTVSSIGAIVYQLSQWLVSSRVGQASISIGRVAWYGGNKAGVLVSSALQAICRLLAPIWVTVGAIGKLWIQCYQSIASGPIGFLMRWILDSVRYGGTSLYQTISVIVPALLRPLIRLFNIVFPGKRSIPATQEARKRITIAASYIYKIINSWFSRKMQKRKRHFAKNSSDLVRAPIGGGSRQPSRKDSKLRRQEGSNKASRRSR